MEFIQESLFGRTCTEPFPATEAKTSAQCSKPSAKLQTAGLMFLDLRKENGGVLAPSWETATALPGGHTTLSIGECPRDAVESTLSQILEANAPEKYSLSARACAGILRRAERRGKELPTMLREALEEVVTLSTCHKTISEEA